jgi:hypothetical protein
MRLLDRLTAMSLITLALASAAARAEAPEGLPLGLGQFHWKMSSAAAESHFPALGPSLPPPDSQLTNQLPFFHGPYRWHECTFTVALYFANDSLTRIKLDARTAGPACIADIERELFDFYGIDLHSRFSNTVHFPPSDTRVSYNSNGSWAEIGLSDATGAPLIIYDTVETQDASPRTRRSKPH